MQMRRKWSLEEEHALINHIGQRGVYRDDQEHRWNTSHDYIPTRKKIVVNYSLQTRHLKLSKRLTAIIYRTSCATTQNKNNNDKQHNKNTIKRNKNKYTPSLLSFSVVYLSFFMFSPFFELKCKLCFMACKNRSDWWWHFKHGTS